jgi:ribosomal 50S subunit-recycling heat shock protein
VGDGEDNMDNNLHDEIAALAYELFENKGKVGGSDIDHWLEAERLVRARYAARVNDEVIKYGRIEYIGDERRRHKRVSVKGIQGNIPCSLDTRIINISLGGVAVETTKKLERNKECGLKINHKGNALRLKGRVIWAVLTRIEKKESGDIRAVYRAGMKFQQPLSRISIS